MLNIVRAQMLMTALANLQMTAGTLQTLLQNEVGENDTVPEYQDISVLDDSLDVVLEARNAYCAHQEIEIENGSIDWNESDIQRSVRKEQEDFEAQQ